MSCGARTPSVNHGNRGPLSVAIRGMRVAGLARFAPKGHGAGAGSWQPRLWPSWSSRSSSMLRPAAHVRSVCPSRTALAGMALGQRIVAIAHSQVGYATDPSDSYCNKFSAYWGAGAPDCPSGECIRGVVRGLRRLGLAEGGHNSPIWVRPRRSERRRDQLLQMGPGPRNLASAGQRLPGRRG